MTRVLFVTCQRGDYMSSVLWDGLCEALGPENVRDAARSPKLHPSDEGPDSNTSIGRHPGAVGNYLGEGEGDFDLMVVIDAFLCDRKWDWPESLRERLRPGGKVAFVVGLDPVDWEPEPTFPVDVVFRRELAPDRAYRLPSRSMPLAAPRRWFDPVCPSSGPGVEWPGKVSVRDQARDIDVFLMGAPSSPARWEAASRVFQTRRRHRSVVGTTPGIAYSRWFDVLKRSKVVVCPPGAGDESLCFWEALACGAVPVHCGHAPRVRDPWFPDDLIFTCSTDALPETLDRALGEDLTERRTRLREWALAHHTTSARAETLLRAVGL